MTSHPTHNLIVSEDVEAALRCDRGEKATLNSYEIKDFTSDGDGFIGFITSVEVKFSIDGRNEITSYVMKINPAKDETMNETMAVFFTKEASFYTQFLPGMNSILKKLNQAPLQIPNCYFSKLDKGKEIICLEDLRNKNLKMYKNESGFDKSHTILVLKELARMHSASVLLAEHHQVEDLVTKFESLEHPTSCEDVKKTFSEYCILSIILAADIAEMMGGDYGKIETYFRSISSDCLEVLDSNYKKCTPPFRVICHGDCWENNVLFRYDELGEPTEAYLLDFQCITSSSLSTDMNHFLFSSTAAKERNENYAQIMSSYYESFRTIIESANQTMKFSQDELERDYRSHNLHGLVMQLLDMPTMMTLKGLDAFEFKDISEEKMKDRNKKVLALVKSHPQFKPRILDTFDEILQHGLL